MNKNSISIAGEFAVLSQLALRGYDANVTFGNTKHVDILVSDPKTNNMYQLEVKTSKNKSLNEKLFGRCLYWMMSKKHETIERPNLFYCFVHIRENAFRFFIIPSVVVARYIRDEHSFFLSADENHKSGDMRKFRIGLDANGYQIKTPLEKEYEDNWDFKVF